MNVFERRESQVRSYCRSFPTVFTQARGAFLYDESGRRYIDLFAGAGALNYGHNPPALKEALLAYLACDGVTHSLDMHTVAKRAFLERFERTILESRGLDYRVQFPGPTGTNAVEAALKVARKATGRQNVVCFTNAFHGMTLGALSLTGNQSKRGGAGVPLNHSQRFPFDGELGAGEALSFLRLNLENSSSGFDLPAAIIVETVQAEGGVRVASPEFLRGLDQLSKQFRIPLIVDDVQVGCGRTGRFFSFEEVGIVPDIVCLSKALSGYGLPLALVLLRPELDVWSPGEHNGTFRGHNLAFVTAAESLRYWENDALTREVESKSDYCRQRLQGMVDSCPALREVRGRGLVLGVESTVPGLPERWSRECFSRGVVVETAGPGDNVLKLLPPLNIEMEVLSQSLDILAEALAALPESTASKAPVLAGGSV